MWLDLRTLLVAVALATAVCAVARILLCRLHPAIPGLGRWAAASILGALALLLIAMQGRVSEILSLSTAQVLMAAGFIVSWDGFRSFVGRARLSASALVLLSFVTLIPIAVAHIEQSLVMRSVVSSVTISLLSVMIARELRRAATGIRAAMRATAWAYWGNAVVFALRAVAAAFAWDGNGIAQQRSSDFPALMLLWWLCMIVATTLGMILMAGERLQQDLDRQASRDPLTGALNRRAFTLAAAKEVARAKRNGQPLTLLMMDLDYFKQTNDRLGHAGGDAMLHLFVAVAGRALREVDVFCRFGGEEFLALLPGSSPAQALAAAERLRAAYEQEAAAAVDPARPLPFALTVSIGVGEMLPDDDLEDAIHRADVALYRAKSSGRNRCEPAVVFVESESGRIVANSSLA